MFPICRFMPFFFVLASPENIVDITLPLVAKYSITMKYWILAGGF